MSDEELTPDAKEFLRRRRMLDPMISSEGWKELEKIGRAQIENLTNMLLEAPAETVDGQTHVLRSEYRKGTIYGIRLMLSTPSAIIETAKDILRQQNKDTSNVSEPTGTATRSPGSDERDDDIYSGPGSVRELGGDE